MTTVRVDARYCGPPASGNGGYCAGLVAEAMGGSDVMVMLRGPIPLETDLDLRVEGDSASLVDGEAVIIEAGRQALDLVVPAPPSFAEARGAEKRFTGLRHHHYPSCFVCGPDRSAEDGLRIFPGSLGSGVAATWTPAEPVDVRLVWAALDCAGYFAVEEQAGLALLGRITSRIERLPAEQEGVIVTGWPIAHDGRKHDCGTALHSADGELLACARSTWITLAR